MEDDPNLAVVIPTRNRPYKLHNCLAALEKAQEFFEFQVYVCDSSPTVTTQQQVREVCKRFSFSHLHFHEGKNVAAARNFCAEVAQAPLLVNVDDDVYVEPDAIYRLYEKYRSANGWRVVGGSVFWGTTWDGPMVMRRIGYGRPALPHEKPSFLIGAFFMYPKSLAEHCPWNERIRYSDDFFMGALWRGHGVSLLHEPKAKAFHDSNGSNHGPAYYDSHIYSNLFDALIANRNFPRAAMYEFVGFAASAKQYFRSFDTAKDLVSAWYRGHMQLVNDWSYLNSLVKTPLPPNPDI